MVSVGNEGDIYSRQFFFYFFLLFLPPLPTSSSSFPRVVVVVFFCFVGVSYVFVSIRPCECVRVCAVRALSVSGPRLADRRPTRRLN